MSALATDLLQVASYLVVAAIFYDLLKPASRALSLLAAFFSIIGCAIQALGSVLQLAALVVSAGARYLSVIGEDQLQMIALAMRAHVLNIALVLFGFYCVLIGYLIFRSAILPHVIGVLTVTAGLAYLTSNAYLPGLGGGLLMLWLIVVGANAQRWR